MKRKEVYLHPSIWQLHELNRSRWAVHAVMTSQCSEACNILCSKWALALVACPFRELQPRMPAYEDLKQSFRFWIYSIPFIRKTKQTNKQRYALKVLMNDVPICAYVSYRYFTTHFVHWNDSLLNVFRLYNVMTVPKFSSLAPNSEETCAMFSALRTHT